MTLRRQLFIAISILFFGIFLGLMWLSLNGTRAYLEQQLASHAQDAASSLSYPVAKSLGENAPELAAMQVTSMFDRGFYQQIMVIDVHGKTLVNKVLPPVIEGVPAWFSGMVSLETPSGEALLSAGWRQLGRVVVLSQPTHAYQYLWQSSLETAGWMGVVYLISLLLTHYLLLLILRPLSEIEHTAEEVSQKRFSQILVRPKALELARVVRAMNAMSKRISEILDAESAKADNFRRQAYQDEVTGLDNRRSFDLRLGELLGGDVHFMEGAVIGLEVDQLKEFNTEVGYQRGNAFLKEMTSIVLDVLGRQAEIAGRTGGSSFAFVILGVDVVALRNIGAKLDERLNDLFVREAGDVLSFSLGVVDFEKTHPRSQIMSRLDLAIESARRSGRNGVQYVLGQTQLTVSLGSVGWKDLIENALRDNRWALLGQPVVNLKSGQLIHNEIMSRLLGADGEVVPASQFLPMALRHRLMADIDRAMISLVLRVLESDSVGSLRLAVNMSLQSIENKEFVKWLQGRLVKLGSLTERLSFELTEYACAAQPDTVREFAGWVRKQGAQFGIDNFGLAPNSLQILRELPPDYVKVAQGLVSEGQTNETSRALIQSIISLAHSLEIEVIAQGVESQAQVDMLQGDLVDAGQGYHFGAPESLK